MTSLDPAKTHLAQLAVDSAPSWLLLGDRTLPGELSIATTNSVYRFRNGVFSSRLKKPSRSFEAPRAMRGARLIGFLLEEAGAWSLSPDFHAGAPAVLWNGSMDAESFILTSACTEFTLEEPEPKPVDPGPPPSPWVARADSCSGIKVRRAARPPTFRRPLPPSTTRLHNAPPFELPR